MLDTIEKRELKVGFVYHGADREKISRSTVLLMISVGQYYHEGEKFEKTVLKLGKRCKDCVVMVNDTLQKYTLKIGSKQTLEQLSHIAKHAGDMWIYRNQPALDKMGVPYIFKRWEDWLNCTDYNEAREQVDSLYNYDNNFRQAIKATTDRFIERYIKRKEGTTFDIEYEKQLCLEYKLEDCAVIIPLWSNKGYKYYLYVGRSFFDVQENIKPRQFRHPVIRNYNVKDFFLESGQSNVRVAAKSCVVAQAFHRIFQL